MNLKAREAMDRALFFFVFSAFRSGLSWSGTGPQIFRKGTILLKMAEGVRLKLSHGCLLQACSCYHGKCQGAVIALEKPSFSILVSTGWVSGQCKMGFFIDFPEIM